jgi:hypothetical protein
MNAKLRKMERDALKALENFEPYEHGFFSVERVKSPGTHKYRLIVRGEIVREHPNPRAVASGLLYYIQAQVFNRGERVRAVREIKGRDDSNQYPFTIPEGAEGEVINVAMFPTVWFDGTPDTQALEVHPNNVEVIRDYP